MAKKGRTFADKVRKMSQRTVDLCPTCNTEIKSIVLISSVWSERTKSWKFNRQNVQLCKCNEKEVYG